MHWSYWCLMLSHRNNIVNTVAAKDLVTQGSRASGGPINIKMSSYQYRDPMLKIRRSCDRLIFNMGIPIPGKDCLCIEPGPCRSHDIHLGLLEFLVPATGRPAFSRTSLCWYTDLNLLVWLRSTLVRENCVSEDCRWWDFLASAPEAQWPCIYASEPPNYI